MPYISKADVVLIKRAHALVSTGQSGQSVARPLNVILENLARRFDREKKRAINARHDRYKPVEPMTQWPVQMGAPHKDGCIILGGAK